MDNAKNIDVVMPMFNSMEYSDDYLKTSGSLWQYYWEEPALTNDGAIKIFMLDVVAVLHLNLNKKA